MVHPTTATETRPAVDAEPATELQAFIAQHPQIFRGADIYNFRFHNPSYRAGLLAAVLTGLVDAKSGKLAVKKYVIVSPPGSKVEDFDSQMWRAALSTYRQLAGQDMEPAAQAWLRDRLHTVRAKNWRHQSVFDIISAQPAYTVVIVTESSNYRQDAVDSYAAPNIGAPLLAEDAWVPQVHALANAAVKLLMDRELYLAFDTNELGPSRKALSDLLCSVDHCGVMNSQVEGGPTQILTARADQWAVWIREGRLGQVFRDIENLPASIDAEKPFLRIQAIHRAGHYPQALQAIREYLALAPKLAALTRVKLARIAHYAGASRLATEILTPSIDELNNQEYLENALDTAHKSGSDELEGKVALRLETLFPGSPGLRQRQQRILSAKRDYAAIAALYLQMPGDEARAKFYEALARVLAVEGVPDYRALITTAGDDIQLVDAYQTACVSDALARNLIVHAFTLAIPLPTSGAQAQRGEQLLVQVLEAILLHMGREGEPAVSLEQIQDALFLLVARLTANPGNRALRFDLADLLAPPVAGMTGLALAASLALRLVRQPVGLQKPRFRRTAGVSWLDAHQDFLKAGFAWLQDEAPVVIGKAIMPRSLLTLPADEAVSAIEDYLEHVPLEPGDDHTHLLLYLTLAASITPLSSDPDFDLRLLRLVAGRLANAGSYQLARDLADQGPLTGADTPRRRRLGWFVMADVYHRGRNYLEGLLAMSCALAADSTCDEDQAWEEIVAIARILRDIGLSDEARAAIRHARYLLQQMEAPDIYAHRLDTLELQVRQLELQRSSSKAADLAALLADVVQHGANVLKLKDVTDPVAVLLGQLIRESREGGITVPAEADDVFVGLNERTRGTSSLLVHAMSAAAPSSKELLSLLTSSVPTRYSSDAGYDMHTVAVIAARMLARDEGIADPVDRSFALELLADRGVATPQWDEAAIPPPIPARVEEPAEIARSLSKEGLNIVQVGFAASGRLVQVNAVNGHLETPAASEGIARARFGEWAATYPYDYGTDLSANVFYTTTARLCLPSLPKGRPLLVVADVGFQPFPSNLLLIGDEFAGRVHPMAAAPSLLWLKAARTVQSAGDGRLCAWVSRAGAPMQALSLIAQRLEPVFHEFHFSLNNEPALPATFAGASMAVIVAHGSVHRDGRYFQVVSDEGHLRVTANDLANALRNVGVVVLFVCSGGRMDKHPEAITTLGLAKQILDRGCSAVIASPWPLDSQVPPHWLPEFMRHCAEGKSIMEANFAANQLVDRQFALDPAKGLAMNVFGNPGVYLCRTQTTGGTIQSGG